MKTPKFVNRLLYSPFLVQLVVTRNCNLSCGYCSEYDQVSTPVPLEILKSRIDDLKNLGALILEFTGGEPMLHPDIFELIRYGREKKFLRTMLISNAYLFNEEKIKKLNEAGLQELQISIDGVLPNETTVKVLKPLESRLKCVAKHAQFKVVLNSVIGSAPPEEVLQVIDFANEHGFVPRVQFVHNDEGQLALTQKDFDLIDEVRGRLKTRFMEGGDYRLKLMKTGEAPFKCRAGSRYLYVDEFGVVRWCSQTRNGFGIDLSDYTFKDLKEQFYRTKPCHAKCTIGCVRNNSRFDSLRQMTGF